MAPQNQQRNLLAMLLSGGGGNPYGNEASGPFATSPRIYGRGGAGGGGAPPAGKQQHPQHKGGGGGGGGGKARTGGGGGGGNMAPLGYMAPPNLDPRAATATSPSSLLESPQMNATSPSSLMVNPGTPYRQVMPAPPNNMVGQTYAGQDRMPGPNPLQGAVDAAPYRPPFDMGRFGSSPMTGRLAQPARPFSPTPPPGGLNYDPNSFAGTVQGFERSMGRPSQGQPVPNPQGGGGFLDFLRNAWGGNL